MPIRSVNLVHQNPNNPGGNNKDFPIKKGVIDRNADIAISEFAPGQELIKDKKLMHCVGVGWLKPTRQKWIIGESNPRPRNVVVCQNCGCITFLESSKFCPECNEVGDNVYNFSSWEPTHYISDFKSKTYEGRISSTPQNISVFPSQKNNRNDFIHSTKGNNFRVCAYTGSLIKANTNDFEGYHFLKVRSGKLGGIYIHEPESNDPSWAEFEWRQPDNLESEGNAAALTTEQITDFLLFSLRQSPTALQHVNPSIEQLNCIRGAWRSLAELVGRAITMKEDIEPTEVSVGIRPLIENDELGNSIPMSWAVFVADTLDNGAGYSSRYADPSSFIDLLTHTKIRLANGLANSSHGKECVDSCYVCIRHYNNRFHHEELDWRLGHDLLSLLLDPSINIMQFSDYWDVILNGVIPSKLAEVFQVNFELAKHEGNPVYINHNENICLVARHPLVNEDCFEMVHLVNKLRGKYSGYSVVCLSPYEFMRKPLTVRQTIISTMN